MSNTTYHERMEIESKKSDTSLSIVKACCILVSMQETDITIKHVCKGISMFS